MNPFQTLPKILISTVLIICCIAFVLRFDSNAGSLTSAYTYFSRIQTNLDGATAGQTVEIIVLVTPSQNISTGGTLQIQFAEADDGGWCRVNGSLTATGVAAGGSAADLAATNWAIDSALPGTFSATCTKGVGAGTVDTIAITGLTALTSGTTYGVKIVSNVGKIGTHSGAGDHELTVSVFQGVTIDSKTFKQSLIADDTVQVSATVSATPSVTCQISASSVNLGTLYPGGAYASGSHTIGTSSSSSSGYYWAVYGKGDGTDAGLYSSGANFIASAPDGIINLTVPGSEGFGLTISDPDAGGPAVVTTNYVVGAAGSFGTIDRAPAGAKLVLYQNGDQGALETATVTYGARAGASRVAGAYTEEVTFVCGGYF